MAERKSVGGIWIKKTKKGDKYLSFSIDGNRYVAFLNNFKDSENKPDFNIFVQQDLPQQQSQQGGWNNQTTPKQYTPQKQYRAPKQQAQQQQPDFAQNWGDNMSGDNEIPDLNF